MTKIILREILFFTEISRNKKTVFQNYYISMSSLHVYRNVTNANVIILDKVEN